MKKPHCDYTWIQKEGDYICLYGQRRNGGNKRLLFKYYISEAIKRGYALGKNIELIINRKGQLEIKK